MSGNVLTALEMSTQLRRLGPLTVPRATQAAQWTPDGPPPKHQKRKSLRSREITKCTCMLMYYVFGQLTKHQESTQSALTHTHVSYSTTGMFRVRSEARTFSHASFHLSCGLEIKHNPTILKEIHVASPDEIPKVDRRSSFVACLRA